MKCCICDKPATMKLPHGKAASEGVPVCAACFAKEMRAYFVGKVGE